MLRRWRWRLWWRIAIFVALRVRRHAAERTFRQRVALARQRVTCRTDALLNWGRTPLGSARWRHNLSRPLICHGQRLCLQSANDRHSLCRLQSQNGRAPPAVAFTLAVMQGVFQACSTARTIAAFGMGATAP